MSLAHAPHRILHSMLRVADLERSIAFYVKHLVMRLLRRTSHDAGRFTLAFLGYDDESEATVLELTYNWDASTYQQGSGYGHLALAVRDVAAICQRLEGEGVEVLRAPGPMAFDAGEVIAFIADPDGYRIELIERL